MKKDIVYIAIFLLLTACGASAGDNNTTNADSASTDTAVATDTADTTAATDSTVVAPEDTAVAPIDAGVNADVPATPDTTAPIDTTVDPDTTQPVDDNVSCENALPFTGKGTPFTGYTYTTPQNQTYTFDCTHCPGGRAELDGLYRYYTPTNKDGTCDTATCCKPNADCGKQNETLLLEGNTWSRVTNVFGPPPVTYAGYYFCPDPAALTNFQDPTLWGEVFVFESIPAQSQLKPGYSNPCHIKSSGKGSIFFECNSQWKVNQKVYYELSFCKVGESVDGVICTDPFN